MRKGKIDTATKFGSGKEDGQFKDAEGKADSEPDLYPKLPTGPGIGEIRNF